MLTERDFKWVKRFLALAKGISTWSKDPSTQCGCVITKGNFIVSTGYNGFAKGVDDSDYDNRNIKYKKIIHAEANAIIWARRELSNCDLYV